MSEPVSHYPHFKDLIIDYPREALELFAPAEAPRPEDAARVVPVREEQLQERLGDLYSPLDVPLLAVWDDGRPEALLYLVAVESDRCRFSRHRLAHCCFETADMFRSARVVVVPVVVFLQPGSAPGPLMLGTERRTYLRLDYLDCSLGDMPAEDWLDSSNVVARVNLPNMRRPPGLTKVDVYAQAVRGLFDLEQDPDRCVRYMDFIDIYADLTDSERGRYRQEHPEESSIMAGLRVDAHRER